jgi:hypothetical protein
MDGMIEASKAWVGRDRGVIVINAGWGPYYINLSDCQTPEQIEEWRQHLSKKIWGPGVIDDFLKVAGDLK